MERRRRLVTAWLTATLVAGCGAATPSAPSGAPAATPTAVAAAPTRHPTVAPTVAPTLPPTLLATPIPVLEESLVEPFPRDAFGDPTTIDNAWLPLGPGTRWTWEGEATVDGIRQPRRVVFTISDVGKVIDGVPTVVGYDLDLTSGSLNEAELVFLAQDDAGNIWHMGQYPEEYEEGVLVGTPIWIAGLDDAAAGIWMKGDPRPYTPSYSQGYGPAVGWTDRARVFEVGSVTCVPAGCYDDVLVIDEFNRDEPDAHQLKYYARGVGNVRVGWAGAREEEREELELVRREQLDAAELARVREEVLAQDARGYEHSPAVYGRTAPAE